MFSLAEVTTTQFREALTAPAVRTSQLIHFAMAAGATAFAFAICLIYFRGEVRSPDQDFMLVNMLSALHGVLIVVGWPLGKWLAERQFSEENLKNAVDRTYSAKDGTPLVLSPAQKCLMVIRSASILRLAMFQAAAFCGLTALVVAVTGGIVQRAPIYFLNFAGAALQILYVAGTFPTAERLEAAFEKYFHKQ